MRERGEIVAITIVRIFVALGAGAVITSGAWAWQNAQDKRQCRRSGGTVVDIDDRKDWHCVGARPEAVP